MFKSSAEDEGYCFRGKGNVAEGVHFSLKSALPGASGNTRRTVTYFVKRYHYGKTGVFFHNLRTA